MSKNVDKLINNFNHGTLGVKELQNQLNMDLNGDEKNQNKAINRICKKLGEKSIIVRSPEDCICEKERQEDIKRILKKLQQQLPEDIWYIMVQYAVYRRTQESLAKELKISHQAVSKKIKRAVVLASRIISLNEYEECFTHYSDLEADKAEIKIRYPADFFSKFPHCRLQEYLDDAFGDEKTICCGYCGEGCNNKVMKQRGECCNGTDN